MPKHLIPFASDDVSALAKSLRAQLASRSELPTHVEMLNMLARAAGHRNFQHLRAGRAAPRRDAGALVDTTVEAAVSRAVRHFDADGRLRSWPARTSVQDLCLWAIWSRLPRGEAFEERSINALLQRLHLFGDPAILRRTMCVLGLMVRTADGRDYRGVERRPSIEGAALIRRLGRPASGLHPSRTPKAAQTP